jgi:natural product biosynthesis luciferase-like monooxygenase protein
MSEQRASSVMDQPADLVRLLRDATSALGDRIVYRYLRNGDVHGPIDTLTAHELEQGARRVASGLTSRLWPDAHGQDDGRPPRVLLLFPSGLEFITAFFGCMLARVIAVPAYPPQHQARNLGVGRLASIMEDCQPSCVLLPERQLDRIRRLAPELLEAAPARWVTSESLAGGAPAPWTALPDISSEDVAFLQYTSGSTARPRGVIVTHANVLANQRAIRETFHVPAGSVGVSWLPLFHDMGLVGGVIHSLYCRSELVLMSPLSFLRRPLQWIRAISHFRAVISGGPNFGFELAASQVRDHQLADLDLGAWEIAPIGAEPVRAGTLERFARRFALAGFRFHSFLPCYGLAESTLLVASVGQHDRPRVVRAEATALAEGRLVPAEEHARARVLVGCGTARGGQSVVIVHPETRRPLPAGVVGEIWVQSGPSVARGYWGGEPDGDEQCFGVTVASGDGARYLRTGDLGVIQDGELLVTGRRKDVVILNGRNYDAHDIEAAADRAHPLLDPDQIIAFADEGDEAERCVMVVGVPASTRPEEMQVAARQLRERVGDAIDIPLHAVVFVPASELPRTSSGKRQRARCRALWREGALTCLLVVTAQDRPVAGAGAKQMDAASVRVVIEQHVRRAARLQEDDPMAGDQTLRALGLDSVGVVELCRSLDGPLGRELPLELFQDNPTVRCLIDRVVDLLDGRHVAPAAAAVEPLAEVTPVEPVAVMEPPASAARAPVPAAARPADRPGAAQAIDLSIMFFSSSDADNPHHRYELLQQACRVADDLGFKAVWLPERHFHPFGGLFPNPAVVAASVAPITTRLRLRAGSVVAPLHDPVRVAEEWSVVDNLSSGRVDVSFAAGWDADSFALAPERYTHRREATLETIEAVRRLWRGEELLRRNGLGEERRVRVHPRPVQPELPVWLTATRSLDSFVTAGEAGYNLLTALLFQSLDEVAGRIAAYRSARTAARQAARAAAAPDPGPGTVTLMLHTYVGADRASVRDVVSAPLLAYLRSSADLWSKASIDLASLAPTERERMLEVALERYLSASALVGDETHCRQMLRAARGAGADEIACLVDFGVPTAQVIESLRLLARIARTPGDVHGPARPAVHQPHAAAAPGPPGPPPTLSSERRQALESAQFRDVFGRAERFTLTDELRQADLLPFYQEFSHWQGTHAMLGSRRVLILGSLDYLGLSVDARVRSAAAQAALVQGTGRSGSRLHAGSSPEHRTLEEKLAAFLGREDALIFATGYQAQAGMISALMGPETTLVVDEAAHASLLDGASIARCRVLHFRHNDPGDLDATLRRLNLDRPTLVAVEGLYSNDGDLAPLPELRRVCTEHGVRLAVDDAHGLGVLGAHGRGIEEHLGCPGAADVLAGTFSKSLASIGGWVAGSHRVIEWVRYHGRSILFTAGIAPPGLAAAAAALDILMAEPELVRTIARNARYMRRQLARCGLHVSGDDTPILALHVGDELRCVQLARLLLERGIYVHTVLYPSVPRDRAMLRLCVTAGHQEADLLWAASTIAEAARQIGLGAHVA